MLHAREINREQTLRVGEVFTVPPKEYADHAGISLSAAERFFKRALEDPKLAQFFRQRGSRIFANRAWFEAKYKIGEFGGIG